MRRGVLLSIAALLVLSGTTHASAADLQAEDLHTTGDVLLQGALGLLLKEGERPTTTHFTLHAQVLDMEVDRGTTLDLGAVDHAADPETDHTSSDRIQVTSTAVRDQHEWSLTPTDGRAAPGVRVEGNCLNAAAAPSDIQRTAWVDRTRPPRDVSKTGMYGAEACNGNLSAVVEGDFTLALWEWDIGLDSDAGSQEATSGRGETDSTGVVQERRQIFLHAMNATLTVPLAPGDTFYVRDAALKTSGSVLVTDARGSIDLHGQPVTVAHEDVWLAGSIEGALGTPQGGVLTIALGGDIREIHLAGQAVRPPSEAPGDVGRFAGAGAGFVVLAAVGLYVWLVPRRAFRRALSADEVPWSTRPVTPREERAAGWLALGTRALAEERLSRSLVYAVQAVRTAPHIPDHRWLRVKVQRARRRPAKTLNDLERLCSMLRPGVGRGRAAYEFGMTLAALRHDDEAAQWMDVARREYPEGYRSVIHLPELAAVRSRLIGSRRPPTSPSAPTPRRARLRRAASRSAPMPSSAWPAFRSSKSTQARCAVAIHNHGKA